jgi:alkanesulfonate monooxygenase SsuD/methylene tetrahydromethanopterin reductase-like flavin-dependent oxidoreductase (luciferase family)
MDFSFFVHMERIDKNQSQKQLYDEYIELCLIAEKGGFSTIWTGEHHGMNFTIAPIHLPIWSTCRTAQKK